MTKEQSDARWWEDVERDPAHEAAAEWFMRLHDPQISLEDTLAWQQWIGADARHAQAFARIENTYLEMGQMQPPPLSIARTGAEYGRMTGADDYDGSMSVSDWREKLRTDGLSRSASRTWIAAIAASVVAVTIALAWVVFGGTGSGDLLRRTSVDVTRTAIGENRSLSLPDGSTVTLGGGTELEVLFGASARRVALSRGEAFFVVAKDASRPFVVRAGDATVTAVGTQFNVRRRNEGVNVTVVEGRVRVEPAPSLVPIAWLRELRPALTPVQVDAGQQTTVGDEGVGAAVSLPDLAAITSWQSGRLAFDREPLRDVLEDVNRYSAKPIVVADETVGMLAVTGTVLGSDIKGWVQSLERAFALEAVEEPRRIVIRRRGGD